MLCPLCGKSVPPIKGRGRPRTYCSTQCSKEAIKRHWRINAARRRLEESGRRKKR